MALNVEDLKSPVLEIRTSTSKIQDLMSETRASATNIQSGISQLQVDIRNLVMEVGAKPKAANKVFGVDRMTEAERRSSLRKTSLVRFSF